MPSPGRKPSMPPLRQKVIRTTRSRREPVATVAAPSPTPVVVKVTAGQTREQAMGSLVSAGVVSNAATVTQWSDVLGLPVEVSALYDSLVATSERVQAGSLEDAEALLISQAATLNAIFVNLAHRARSSSRLDHFDTYLRLALRSQAQCRATCETLAVVKNPPVFARQANISHGPQQINNNQQINNGGDVVNGSPARASISASTPNKLLEGHGERVDGRTTTTARQSDPALAPVGAFNGAAER